MENGNKKPVLSIPEDMEFNLSDFALFLSVMKNKKAYESTLSIITDNPKLSLKEVHVEEVVLNKSGKRAIRLDAWAIDTENRQYNTEMQNEADQDDLRKRARFYQGLIDTPILKSGRKTRYRHLPSTMIIFITQEDIFGKNLAQYTFTEQCEEVSGLRLEDGTTKVFLNMSSQTGRPELISLLQYMKETRMDNPNILVKDKRILKLAEVVEEVKQSEEWEAVKMSILSVGIERGTEIGKEIGTEIGKEIGKELGIKLGRTEESANSILDFLQDLGPVPETLIEKIREEKDIEKLRSWLKKAARANSIEAFVKEIELSK